MMFDDASNTPSLPALPHPAPHLYPPLPKCPPAASQVFLHSPLTVYRSILPSELSPWPSSLVLLAPFLLHKYHQAHPALQAIVSPCQPHLPIPSTSIQTAWPLHSLLCPFLDSLTPSGPLHCTPDPPKPHPATQATSPCFPATLASYPKFPSSGSLGHGLPSQQQQPSNRWTDTLVQQCPHP